MDPNTQNSLISALSGLVGALIGGLFTMWANIRANKKQMEMQAIQLRSQSELKARELMFNAYQKESEERSQEMKQLGQQITQLSMAKHLPNMDEMEYQKALLGFVGTIKVMTDPIASQIEEIDDQFKEAGLYEKYKTQIDFVKAQMNLTMTDIRPAAVERSFQNISKALAYLAGMQGALVEQKKMELFSEFLPTKRTPTGA